MVCKSLSMSLNIIEDLVVIVLLSNIDFDLIYI